MVVIGGSRHALGRDARRHPLHLGEPPSRPTSSCSHAVSTLPGGAAHTAAAAALHPRHPLHPRRLLRARRARAGAGCGGRPSSGCATPVSARGGVREDRVGVTGRGTPVLLVQGLGYTRLGLGPDRGAASPSATGCCASTTAGSASRTSRPGPTPSTSWRSTRCRCSTRRASSARTSSGRASAGWSPRPRRRAPRARRPARARAARRRAARTPFPMPEVTTRLMAEARGARPRGRAAPLRRERARPDARRRARRRALRLPRSRARPIPRAGRRRRPPALTCERRSSSSGSRRRRSSSRDRGQRRRPAERRPARASGSRMRGVELLDGTGHMLFWEQPEECRGARRRFLG